MVLLKWGFCFLRGKTVLRRHVGVKVGFYGILQTVYKLKNTLSHLWKLNRVSELKEKERMRISKTLKLAICRVSIAAFFSLFNWGVAHLNSQKPPPSSSPLSFLYLALCLRLFKATKRVSLSFWYQSLSL